MIAIAVADDAFIHPEPGVAAGDHIVSGLVPLTAAVLLIVIAPRLRNQVRGWTAILVGALAIVGGVTDGVRHIAVDRVSGDDISAVLAALAGTVLVVLGIATVWRTRSRSGSRRRRLARRTAGGVAMLALAVLVVLPTGIAIFATHKARSPVEAVDLGQPYRQVQLVTSDGFRLRAWYVPSRNRAAIIAFPGRSQPVPHARMLVRHGYGVLLLDRRGEGASDGDYNAFGWTGERDLGAALTFLRRQPDVDPTRIGGLGLSVGGELLLQTAAHTQALRAVVSEGAGQRSLAEHLDNPEVGRVQRWVSGMLAQTAGSRRPLQQPTSRQPGGPDAADRAATGAADRGAERQPRRGPQRGLRRARRPLDRAVEDRRGRAHGRTRRAPPTTSSASSASSTVLCASRSDARRTTHTVCGAEPRTGAAC